MSTNRREETTTAETCSSITEKGFEIAEGDINPPRLDIITPQTAGCSVTPEDTPIVIASIACFACFIVYGASVASLGSALPSLASHFDIAKGNFGVTFTVRGIGYLVGTLGSAAILEFPGCKFSKQFMVCIAVAITGLAGGLIASTSDYNIALFLFCLQGVGFGGIDVMANCVLPELWGLRVQPWMQALHSCFGIGAIIGPLLVGGLGWYNAFIVIAVSSSAPIFSLMLFEILKQDRTAKDEIMKRDPISEYINTISADVNSTTIEAGSEDVPLPPPVPKLMRILITVFFFFYVGAEAGYGGWVSTYVLEQNVTSNISSAAFVSAIFWGALTVGRFVAIPLAVVMTATTMLRIQLVLSLAGCILVVTIAKHTYIQACIASAIYGYALSSIFPLAMTISADYGFTMDTVATTMFVVGATVGESVVPVLIGLAMMAGGVQCLAYSIIVCTGIITAIYMVVHYLVKFGIIVADVAPPSAIPSPDNDEEIVSKNDYNMRQGETLGGRTGGDNVEVGALGERCEGENGEGYERYADDSGEEGSKVCT